MISFRRGPTILPHDAGGERLLATVIAILCCLACLAAVGASAANRAAHGWARALGAEATVQVRPRVGETGAEAAARAAETLAGVTGVEEAEAMKRAEAEALLRPWIGDAVLPDLPIPFLVTVRLDRDAPASAVTLSRALAEAGVDASVDDHTLWRGEVERSANTVTTLALIGFLIIAGAAGAVVAYATRAGMAAQGAIIETLSLNGASDSRIAGLYQTRYALLALGAGAAGTLGAMVVVAAVRFLGGAEGVTPALPVAWSDVWVLSPCPLLAATVALVAARIAALARLRGRR
ncbi:cell division protein FtsX [Brevundimonas sp. NPDC092305]|uniref:cell division protein FtsX n=1 Tax=Brevundimonas sp. NPDC092305 TaxID=3363957 RepID=UPI0038017604